MRGRADIVSTLIERDASINLQNKVGISALMFSALEGHTTVLRTLLDAGARTDLRDEKRDSVMDYAKRNGRSECVRLLDAHEREAASKG